MTNFSPKKQLQIQTVSTEKRQITLLYEKAACEMLMKLSPQFPSSWRSRLVDLRTYNNSKQKHVQSKLFGFYFFTFHNIEQL